MQQIDKNKLQRIIRILWITLISIPIGLFVLISIGQFKSIEIDGKGDTGHPRSLSHPFICRSSSSFTDRGTLYYCDYHKFIEQTQYTWSLIFSNYAVIEDIYRAILILLIPATIYVYYPRQNTTKNL
jgi:hypothetical protein